MKTKKCTVSGTEFTITEDDLKFYEKMGVPEPILCSDESLRMLMAHRNELRLFRRKCDKTDTIIISAYEENCPFPVWKNEEWWGDGWDGVDYGKEIDLDRSFFDQFKELLLVVPREGTSVFRSENCPYNGHIRDSKNCHLNSLVSSCEDTHYSYWVVDNKDVVDCVMVNNSELCYNCVDIEHCYECVSSQDIANCQNCYFSFQLRGCDNCIGCSNLYKKSYHIFNKPVSKDEFKKMKDQIINGSIKTFREGSVFLEKIKRENAHKSSNTLNSENVTGDHLYSSKNCENCFDGHGNEDCKDSISLDGSTDIHRCYSAGWPDSEMVYSSAVTRGSTDIAFSYYTFFSEGLRYCDSCNYCKDCFGCIGLKHKQYCILNKQYTKEAYFELKEKLIKSMEQRGEWGLFFPPSCTTFAYNDSVAGQYYPLEKNAVEALGYRWREDIDSTKYIGDKYDVPENIKEVTDEILSAILTCEKTGKNYRIIKQELEFYRKMNLPIPRVCPDQRHQQRIELRNARKLHTRKCSECQSDIQTTYAPDRTEKVVCKECYVNAVN